MRLIAYLLLGALLSWVAPAMSRELVVAQVVPQPGDPLSAGYHVKAGIELYFDVVNDRGGILKAPIRLVVKERGLTTADTIVKTREVLAESKPVALIGLMGTGPMEALIKEGVIDQAAVPVVGIRSGAVSLRDQANGWLFHTRSDYAVEADRIVKHLTTIGIRRIAVFHEGSAYGKEGMHHAVAALERAGLKPLLVASYQFNTDSDAQAVQAPLRAIVAAAPDAVVAIGSNTAVAEFFKGLKMAGQYSTRVVALSTVDAWSVTKVVGPDYARGLGIAQVVPDPANQRSALAREFQASAAKFRDKKFELTPGAMEGYVAAKVLVEGLRRAGPDPTPKRLKQALESMKSFDIGGMVIGFSPANHSGSSYVDIGIVGTGGRMMN